MSVLIFYRLCNPHSLFSYLTRSRFFQPSLVFMFLSIFYEYKNILFFLSKTGHSNVRFLAFPDRFRLMPLKIDNLSEAPEQQPEDDLSILDDLKLFE